MGCGREAAAKEGVMPPPAPRAGGGRLSRNLRGLPTVDIIGGGKAVFLVHKEPPSGIPGG